MKKLIYITIALLSIWSCARFDDTKIWDKFAEHEQRIERLEAACDVMNSNISALQAIVTALQGNDFVTGVAEIVEDGVVVGYSISFSKSGVVKIYHGKDGADGEDGSPGADGRPGADGAAGSDGVDGENGHSPVMGVRKDADGVYYWTIDGEWMLDADGQKVPATGKDGEDAEEGTDGKDGVTPLLKIEDGYWFVSYDGGVNWTKLYKAVGENGSDGADGAPGAPGQDGKDGQSFFQGVDTSSSEDYIILTLADGTQIKLPTWKAFEELQTIVNKLNTNVSALQVIVEALQNNDYVTGITPITKDGVEIGYTIDFSKSKSITVYHGKDGADGSDGAAGAPGQDGEAGKDGYTPVLGVKAADDDWSLDNDWDADSEGQTRYYWTLDGEWLLDSDGNRIPASGTNGTDGSNGSAGKNGTTPKLKIMDGYWYVSLDGGQTWQPEPLGPATAGAGGSIFTDISYDSAYLYITLSNNVKISLARHKEDFNDYCRIESMHIFGKNVTFNGELQLNESDVSYTQLTIYYAIKDNSTKFSIYIAERVTVSIFDYNQNFSISLKDLQFNTKYNYCIEINVRGELIYSPIYEFMTDNIGKETVTKTYSNNGYISIKDGQVKTHNTSWIHTDFLDISSLAENDEGFCTSQLLGHDDVANIAYYSEADLESYITGKTCPATESKRYTAKEIKEAAPSEAVYVVFSTHTSLAPLQVAMYISYDYNEITKIDTREGIVIGTNKVGSPIEWGVKGIGSGTSSKYFIPAKTNVTIEVDPIGYYGYAMTNQEGIVTEIVKSGEINEGVYTFQAQLIDTYLYTSDTKLLNIYGTPTDNPGYSILEMNSEYLVAVNQIIGEQIQFTAMSTHNKYLIPARMTVTIEIKPRGHYGFALTDLSNRVIDFTRTDSEGSEMKKYTFNPQTEDCYLYVSSVKLESIIGEY